MGFEKDYTLFLKFILSNESQKAEEILSYSDNRRALIAGALNDLGEIKVRTFIETFKSVGLKKGFNIFIIDFNKKFLHKDISFENATIKKVFVHQKNKEINERYHLSGSSFDKNKRVIKVPA